jgi:hypothetical protein
MKASASFMAAIATAAGLLSACTHGDPSVAAFSPSALPPPPAVSSIDHTVSVTWTLLDSFDIDADGTCYGRSANRGIEDRALVQIKGNATGFIDETRVTAYVHQYALSPKEALLNDGLDCVVQAVLSPSIPDPSGYTVKFPNALLDTEDQLGTPSHSPFGMADTPGYGAYHLQVMRCPSALDPPDKDCLDWAKG